MADTTVTYEKGKLYQLELAQLQADPNQPRKSMDPSLGGTRRPYRPGPGGPQPASEVFRCPRPRRNDRIGRQARDHSVPNL